MKYSDDALGIILLNSYLAINNEEMRPFSIGEWNKFAIKLLNTNLKRPEALLHSNFQTIKRELSLNEAEGKRIEMLLSRGGLLALQLEELWNKGIEIVTRADDMYPKNIKDKLKQSAPPLLYYFGDLKLANMKGIAIVGSRDIETDDLEYTKKLAQKAVSEDLIIFSGGAKGIDTVSESEALNNGGKVVSFIADSLESKIRKKEIRSRIEEGRLLVFSGVKPNSGFSVPNAMNRNKYIYALSSGAFVIKSDYKKGGTWAGATENIQNCWVKTYIRMNEKVKGNCELLKMGGFPIGDIINLKISELLNVKDSQTIEKNKYQQLDLFSLNRVESFAKQRLETDDVIEDDVIENERKIKSDFENKHISEKPSDKSSIEGSEYDLYGYVIDILLRALNIERGIEELSNLLKVNKIQLREWIGRAISDDKIIRLGNKDRFIRRS